MVTMRSSSGMKPDSTFSSVVLPAPVPPEITMFSRARTQALQQLHHAVGQRQDVHQVLAP